MDAERGFRSGFVTLLGRPNAGKSTLLNAIMHKKFAIAPPTARTTTRHRFRAIHTTEDYQLVIVDTPGLHKPHDALGEELNTTAIKALEGVDVAAFLLDASEPLGTGRRMGDRPARECEEIRRRSWSSPRALRQAKKRSPRRSKPQARLLAGTRSWSRARSKARTSRLFVDAVVNYLPEGPLWFPADMETDQPQEVIVAEFIREKILFQTVDDEVPHAIGVVVEEMGYNRRKHLTRIYATIYVERDSQKGILVGKGGATIKHIGTEARKDLEVLLGTKVYLDLQVKVKEELASRHQSDPPVRIR